MFELGGSHPIPKWIFSQSVEKVCGGGGNPCVRIEKGQKNFTNWFSNWLRFQLRDPANKEHMDPGQLQQLIGHPWNNWTGKGRERGRLKTSQRTSCSDGIC